MLPAHALADHVLGQTDAQSAGKATSWVVLARHVAQYHLVVAGVVGLTVALLGVPLTAAGITLGLAVSVGTHLLWDSTW